MKQIIFIAAATFSLSACAQHIPASKVPSVVQNSVQSKFSQANKVEWEKKDAVYEAEFDVNNIEHTIYVEATGKIVAAKQDMKETELPVAVTAALSQYPGYKVDDASKLEKDGITYYQVELEAKGKKDVDVVFSADGKVAASIPYMK